MYIFVHGPSFCLRVIAWSGSPPPAPGTIRAIFVTPSRLNSDSRRPSTSLYFHRPTLAPRHSPPSRSRKRSRSARRARRSYAGSSSMRRLINIRQPRPPPPPPPPPPATAEARRRPPLPAAPFLQVSTRAEVGPRPCDACRRSGSSEAAPEAPRTMIETAAAAAAAAEGCLRLGRRVPSEVEGGGRLGRPVAGGSCGTTPPPCWSRWWPR